jgi:glucokinase
VSAAAAVGVDLGGTKIGAGLVDEAGALEAHTEQPTPVESQDELISALSEVVDSLLQRRRVAAIGFGVPSQVDQVARRVVGSVHVPLGGIDLAGVMSGRFGVPVVVDNDANSAAYAEWRLGAGRGTSHMIMLTLGTGVGGGLVLGGELYRGALGVGAELGHLVVDVNGPPCGGTCNGYGHLETLVSGRAADARARSIGLEDARALVTAARAGEPAARQELDALGRLLGRAVAGLANVFNPELVVIGGGFGAAGELLLEPARAVVAEEALPAAASVRIEPARLGPEAGVVGAGLLALAAATGP